MAGLADLIPSLIQGVPYIMTQMKGKNLKPQKQTLGQLGNVANAQYNTDNPIFQKLYGQNTELGQRDLASTIAEISRQNRKLTSMGRRPLLDQERGGESIFRNLVMGQGDVGARARTDTFGQLRNATNSLNNLYDGQNLIADEDYENSMRKNRGYYSIGDALKGLFNLD